MSSRDPHRPLRILMVIHTPWTRNLGGPRVQLELGEELTALGHEVAKWSYEDAFPPTAAPPPRTRWAAALAADFATNRDFSRRAVTFVRRTAQDFDIIDAHQTDLPVAKARLGFNGLLVARSVGLIPAYEAFERWATERWPQAVPLRERVRRLLSYPGARRRRRRVLPSLRHSDLINVSNRDDLATVRDTMGFGDKVVCFPFGLAAGRRAALAAAQQPAAERLRRATVAFIGTWNQRKGAADWPAILDHLRRRNPSARLLLLGTGLGAERVLASFPAELRGAVQVVPAYDSDELPGLLASATVGAFPGYLEGFGFSVLEKLAAGLPTVTYDAPGPRDQMQRLARPRMVPPGDVEAFAGHLAEVLALSPTAYEAASADSHQAADTFAWSRIARATLDTYRERLDRRSP